MSIMTIEPNFLLVSADQKGLTISWWNIEDIYLGPVTELICISTVHSTDVKPCIFEPDWTEHQVWGGAVMYLKGCLSYVIHVNG